MKKAAKKAPVAKPEIADLDPAEDKKEVVEKKAPKKIAAPVEQAKKINKKEKSQDSDIEKKIADLKKDLDDDQPKKKAAPAKKPVVQEEESEEEEVKPIKKQVKAKQAVKKIIPEVAAEDDDDEEEEKPVSLKKSPEVSSDL